MWKLLVVVALLVAIGSVTFVRIMAAGTRDEAAKIAAVLELREGSRVADVGAGKGSFSIELARRVGPSGHVFATEMDSTRLRQIRAAAAKAGVQQVSAIEGAETRTGLEPNCCEAIFMRRVYHHVTKPKETNDSLREALRPGGRLAIIDFPSGWFLSTFFRVTDVPSNRGGHGVPPEAVIEELEAAGLVLDRRIDEWPGRTYCLVFRRPA